MATFYKFQTLAQKGKLEGVNFKDDATKAMTWFRDKASESTRADPRKMQAAAGDFKTLENLSVNSIGKMYLFQYQAKTAVKLPYWDAYPLIFPFSFGPDRMLGMNMHYLPPYLRAKLMDALYETLNNQKWDKSSKLLIDYQTLNSASQFSLFKPTIHSYLYSYVRSGFTYIPPTQWDYTLMLPMQRFQKASAATVWADSIRKL